MSSPSPSTTMNPDQPEVEIADILGNVREGQPIDFTRLREKFRALEAKEAQAEAPPVAEPVEVIEPAGSQSPLMDPAELARRAAQGPPPRNAGVPLGVARVPASAAVPGTPAQPAGVPVGAPVGAPAPRPEPIAASHVEQLDRPPTIEDLANALDQAGFMFADLFDRKQLLAFGVRLGISLTPKGWEIGTAHFQNGDQGQTAITGHRVEHDALGAGMVSVLKNTVRILDPKRPRR